MKYSVDNKAVKPTGKLRVLSAYRFYRREEVPKIKQEKPELDGKARHALVRLRWRVLSDEAKLPFVLMSRADKERALYMNKICQTKENLIRELPLFANSVYASSQNVLGYCHAEAIFARIDAPIKSDAEN